jgi:signal transduction histidine kinase
LDDQRRAGTIRGEGYGLIGMRERAELGAGTLDVDGLTTGGTRVTLELPSG